MESTWRISASEATIRELDRQLRGFVRKRIDRSSEIEDLVNTTWLEAGRSFKHRCSLRHYLFFIAARQLWTRTHRRSRIVLDGSDVDQLPLALRRMSSALLLAEWQTMADAAAAQVQDPYDQVIRMWLDGHETISIARELGINYNTARSRLARGRQQFYAALDSTPAST